MMGWPWIILWQLAFIFAGISLIWMLRQLNLTFQTLGYGLDGLVLFTSIGLLFSAASSTFPELAIWNLILVSCYGILLYGVRNVLTSSADRAYILWAGLVISSWVTSVISLAYWQPDPSMWVSGNFQAAIRNALPLGHHNFVGGYFALTLPLVFSFALYQKHWTKWFFILANSVVLVALYVSGSRGAYLGCIVYAVAALGTSLWQSRGTQRKRVIVIGLIGLIILVAGIGTNPRVRDLISGVEVGQETTAIVQIGDGPTRDRWFMLRTAINILRDHPLLGIGPGNMARVSNLYRPIETGTGLDHVQQLHNMPAQLAGELGLWGIAIYLGWIGLCSRLWLRIHKQDLTLRDRWMLYGVGGSTLSYGVSSLTDYQLENIGISLVLTLNTTLLIYLADRYVPNPSVALPNRLRRIGSLGIFALLAIALRIWLPMDAALYLGHLGYQQAQTNHFVTANQKWATAAKLVSWDPTYDALAGEMLYELESIAEDDESKNIIQAGIVEHFSRALEVAPNDIWFNQNLAIAYFDQANFSQAERYASRTVQLLPRNNNRTYFLLGNIYLAQNRLQDAITAFALEGLVNPVMVLTFQWLEPPLSNIHEQVLETCKSLYEQLLDKLEPSSAMYQQIYTTRVLLSWWFDQPTKGFELKQVKPLVQALLKAESAPQEALEIIDQNLELSPDQQSLALLKAWIDPTQYLDQYLETEEIPETIKEFFKTDITETRDIHVWVKSMWQPEGERRRSSLALAYRNIDARNIQLLLRPQELQTNLIADWLNLFPNYPREFPPLEALIESIRTEALGLPHPTYTDFQLTKLPTG